MLTSTSHHAQAARWDNLSQPVFISPLQDSSTLEGPISAITEDQQGFIWLVSANGLWRWDSQTLQATTFAESNRMGPPQVITVTTSTSGSIWVGTDQGLYQVKPGTTTLEPVAADKLSHITIELISVTSLNNTPVLLLSGDRTLYQFNVATENLEALNLPDQPRIHALHIDVSQRLWVGTGNGLFTAPPASEGYTELVPATGLAPTRISSIVSTQNLSLVVGTAAEGLFIKRPDQKKFLRLDVADNSFRWFYSLTEIRPNVVLAGTFGKGLIEIDLATGLQRHFVNNRLQPGHLSDNNVWALFSDSNGLVWIGAGQSLNVYDGQDTAVKNIFGDIGAPHGLLHRKVSSVQAFNDSLLVGNGPAGIRQLFPDDTPPANWWAKSRDPVETLYVSEKNNIFASSNFSTVRIDHITGQANPLNLAGRNSNRFTDAFIETADMLWLGSTDGLWMAPKDGQVPAQAVFKKDTEEQRVASLFLDDRTLWIGTWQGLLKARLTPPTVSPPVVTTVDHPVIKQQFIADIHEDHLGQLWVGTSNAGLFVKTAAKNWLQIQTLDGLPGNAISAIAGDSRGYLWVGTSQGIAAVDINSYEVSATIAGKTAINSPIFRSAGTHTVQDEMVFGGINGLTIINPEAFDFSRPSLPLLITHIDVVTGDNLAVSNPLNNHQPFSLAPLPKRITFEFVALDYLQARNIQYRYRLLELDDDWVTLKDAHNTITLTTPSPGDYILQIQYSVDGQPWQKNGIIQRFSIKPAWYQTLTAKIIGVFLLGGLLYLLNQLALRHYRYRQTLLEHRVQERTAELLKANQKLSEQADALQKASLTDALTGLHNRRYLDQNIHNDIAKLHDYYQECYRSGNSPAHSADILFFLIDLDHFKRVNDTFGHHAGDSVLVEAQRRLKQIFRDTDYLIRWGGEEFLVVVHDTPREAAPELAERINQSIAATPFNVNEGNHHPVTCSIGFAAYPLSTQHFTLFDWEFTVAVADAALYHAKGNQRNTWVGVSSIPREISCNQLIKIQQQPKKLFAYVPVLTRQSTI